jgi:hypothetical protein
MEKRKYTFKEWIEKGKEIFGTEDRKKWKFRCPSCGFVQSLEDFIKAGTKEEDALGMIGFSCVGRVMQEKGEFLKDKKQPCNYAGGGLIGLNPVTIITPDGTEHNYFEFEEVKANSP